MLGMTLGNYRINQRLAAGGMGEVYIGEHTLIGRKAAVKVLLPHVSQRPQIVERFFQEAKATAAIGHPGIVEIYDFGFHNDGRAYLVMEFLDGETLSACIKRERRLPLERSVAIMRRVASALGAAHDKGIVHRDLKPDNIFLVPSPDSADGERIKLLDFGIAKLQDNGVSALETGTGVVMGTPAYMAPEQCRGAGRVDHRADVYALGCIFFELVCGRRPFVGVGAGELIGMQQFKDPPRPRSVWPEINEATEALILHLLEKQPEDRVQSTAELRARLDELMPLHTISGIATPRPGTVQPVARASQPSLSQIPVAPVMPTTPRPGTAQPVARASISTTTLHSASAERASGEQADGSKRWYLIAGVAAVLVGIGVGGVLVTSGGPGQKGAGEMAAAMVALDGGSAGDETVAVEPAGSEPTPGPEAEPEPEPEPEPEAVIEMHALPDALAEISVAFASDPEGATVTRQGKKETLCTTPCTLTVPGSQGELVFTVSKSGYRSRNVTFDGTKGGKESVTLRKRKKKTVLPDDIPL